MSQIDRYTCEQVFRRLDDFIDRELTPDDTQKVRQHLETCANCAAEYRFQAGVISGLRDRLRRIKTPQDLKARLALALDQAAE